MRHLRNIIPIFFFGLVSYPGDGVFGSGITVTAPTKNLPLIDEISASGAGGPIANFITNMIGFAAILSIIAVTVAAIMMILSVGQQEKFKKARAIALYAIVGFAISALAYLIVRIVTSIDLSTTSAPTSFIIF